MGLVKQMQLQGLETRSKLSQVAAYHLMTEEEMREEMELRADSTRKTFAEVVDQELESIEYVLAYERALEKD